MTINILKTHDDSYSKIIREHKIIYKDKMTKMTKKKTKTQTKYLKHPTYAIFLRS